MDKVKFNMEYSMGGIPMSLLWTYLSTPSGLSRWFSDTVVQQGKLFTFGWSGSEQQATLLAMRTNSYMRFRWTDERDKSYFELRLEVSEFSDRIDLVVTDFALPDEVADQRELWRGQVETLQRQLGCAVG